MLDYGNGERGLVQKGTVEFWVVMKLFCILFVIVVVQLHLSNLQNCTFKRVNFTVCKLYLKNREKETFVRGFCFYANVFMSMSISNVR